MKKDKLQLLINSYGNFGTFNSESKDNLTYAESYAEGTGREMAEVAFLLASLPESFPSEGRSMLEDLFGFYKNGLDLLPEEKKVRAYGYFGRALYNKIVLLKNQGRLELEISESGLERLKEALEQVNSNK